MSVFFSNPSHHNVLHAQKLANYIDSTSAFNRDDDAHRELIANCTKEVKQKLLALQRIDRNALIGFSLGAAALGLSFILPFGVLAAAGFAYGAYQLGLRQRAYMDYVSALENLIGCCQWSLGAVEDKAIINHDVIKGMMTTLAPLTNEKQLRDYIDDQYEDIFVKEAAEIRAHTSVMEYELNQKETTLYYKIYGYEQGGALAILQGIGYAIVNGFKAVKRALTPSSYYETETTRPQPHY